MQGTKVAVKESVREMPHILVVDDEKSIGELLEITFRKEGHRVEVVHSVEAAKRKLESQIFDIIISDVRMPRESGVDLLKFAKEIAPGSFFLLMTALPALDTAIAALNSGADRYVIKGDSLVDQLRLAASTLCTTSTRWPSLRKVISSSSPIDFSSSTTRMWGISRNASLTAALVPCIAPHATRGSSTINSAPRSFSDITLIFPL